jgi:hypothetical protein
MLGDAQDGVRDAVHVRRKRLRDDRYSHTFTVGPTAVAQATAD